MLRGAGAVIVGILVLGLLIGSMAICQIGYGTVAPFIPGPLRGLVGNTEYEAANADYFWDIENAFERYAVDADKCQASRDQRCLTAAVQALRDRLNTGVPATASWMSSPHSDLVAAINRVLEVHRRSERTPIISVSDPLYTESVNAIEQFQSAIDAWVEQSRR